MGYRAARVGENGWLYGLTAAAIAAATGAMGCVLGGALGVTGMLGGMALGAVPLLALVPKRP